MKHKIAVIGSGNWGTAISKIIAQNVLNKQDFENEILMWTFEETVDNEKLTYIINTKHENVKYLPGIILPENLQANPDIIDCINQANILVFVVPHQFIKNIILQIKDKIKENTYLISLTKGALYKNGELTLISEFISRELNNECAVLMGANIANQIAEGCISEGTLACKSEKLKKIFMDIFNCYNYRVAYTEDVSGVELCGTLKNIVSLAYGIANGLGYPSNTTIAILRNGLKEMVKFCTMFYSDVKYETFFESSGIADLFVSSLSGRNYKCGEKLPSMKCIQKIESEMGGQKLQGTITAMEIYEFLKYKGKENEFPLFCMVYKICYEDEICDSILEVISHETGCNK